MRHLDLFCDFVLMRTTGIVFVLGGKYASSAHAPILKRVVCVGPKGRPLIERSLVYLIESWIVLRTCTWSEKALHLNYIRLSIAAGPPVAPSSTISICAPHREHSKVLSSCTCDGGSSVADPYLATYVVYFKSMHDRLKPNPWLQAHWITFQRLNTQSSLPNTKKSVSPSSPVFFISARRLARRAEHH